MMKKRKKPTSAQSLLHRTPLISVSCWPHLMNVGSKLENPGVLEDQSHVTPMMGFQVLCLHSGKERLTKVPEAHVTAPHCLVGH